MGIIISNDYEILKCLNELQNIIKRVGEGKNKETKLELEETAWFEVEENDMHGFFVFQVISQK